MEIKPLINVWEGGTGMITNHPIGILDREQNFCAGGSRRHRMADLPGNSNGDPGDGGDQACHEK